MTNAKSRKRWWILGDGEAQAVILKSETYNFHRLDLTRQAGFIVTIYDEDGLRLAATMPFSTPAEAGLSTLNEGAVIEYELVANKGKESAENIKVK